MVKCRSVSFLFMIFFLMFPSCGHKNRKISKNPVEAIVEENVATCLEEDRSDFCSLTDSVPDAVLDIRYYSTYNFVGKRIDGYDDSVALMTREAASALRRAAKEFRAKGYRLKIYDAYRPQCAVDHFLRWAQDPADTAMKSVFYPDIDKPTIFRRGFVASKSSHSRGSTVDLTLVDILGKDVDMGGVFDFFGDVSHLEYAGVTKAQHDNRLYLHDVMVRHGFVSISDEWWHFTLRNEPYPDTYFVFRNVKVKR